MNDELQAAPVDRLVMPCPFCGGRSVSTREGSTFRWRESFWGALFAGLLIGVVCRSANDTFGGLVGLAAAFGYCVSWWRLQFLNDREREAR